jgi:hypothetical protein
MKTFICCGIILLVQTNSALPAEPDAHVSIGEPNAGTSTQSITINPLPMVVVEMPAEIDRVERAEAQAQRREEARRDATMSLWTLGLLVVAMAQAGLFLYQLTLMRRSVEDATKAANAANLSARIARKSMLAEFRPVVVATPKRRFVRTGDVTVCHIYVSFKNYGRGTAINLRTSAKHQWLSPGEALEPFTPNPEIEGGSTLAPTQLMNIRSQPIALDQAKQMSEGKLALQLFFYVQYRDPSNPRALHYQKTQYQVEWPKNQAIDKWFRQVSFLSRGTHKFA